MMGSLFAILAGSLLIAIAITMKVGPVRLLAGLVAVPIMWAIIVIAAGAAWIAWHMHGGLP
jgi:hypothetical protein